MLCIGVARHTFCIYFFLSLISAFPTHCSAECLCRHHPCKTRYGRHAQDRLRWICTCCLNSHTVSLREGLARTNGTHPLLCKAYVPRSRTPLVTRAEEFLPFCPGRLFQTHPSRHISIFTNILHLYNHIIVWPTSRIIILSGTYISIIVNTI